MRYIASAHIKRTHISTPIPSTEKEKEGTQAHERH